MFTTSECTAGDPQTAQAGATLLRAGGNAIDAAVGAMFAAYTAEPVLTGPYGGGFAMVSCPDGSTVAYDFFANFPGLGTPHPPQDFEGIEVSFGPTTQVFHAGRSAAAVPLLLQGLLQLHQEKGRLTREQMLQPALDLARNGATLSSQVAGIMKILTPILTLTPHTSQVFAPNGPVLKGGDVFKNPTLASFLSHVAHTGQDPCTNIFTQHFGPPHGMITPQDMAARTVHVRQPVRVSLGCYDVLMNPLPSVGGLLVGFGLLLLEDVPANVWQDETASLVHLWAAMAITQQARTHVLDPAVLASPEAQQHMARFFLTPAHMQDWKKRFKTLIEHGEHTTHPTRKDLGSTTHISCVDKDGYACSITSSNGEGCGHILEGTGCMPNNFLGEEDINPGGFHKGIPGTRMTSMMCPTLVMRNNQTYLALGTGGSNRIRTALLQVLTHHLMRGCSVEDAVKMPRLHYEGGALYAERTVFGKTLSDHTLDTLQQCVSNTVFFDAPNMFFGGVHVASKEGHGYGDPRRAGMCYNTHL
jgi:gamma-glutamyltranspeptidase/glutathione hydrolase